MNLGKVILIVQPTGFVSSGKRLHFRSGGSLMKKRRAQGSNIKSHERPSAELRPARAVPKTSDQRLLSKAECALIARSHSPAIKALSDRALGDLAAHLRKARDRAVLVKRYQSRALRGQKPVSGVIASHRGGSSRHALLAAAVTRVARQIERRRVGSVDPAPASMDKHASSQDHAFEDGTRRTSPARPAIGDIQPVPRTEISTLRRRGMTPVLERSRTRR